MKIILTAVNAKYIHSNLAVYTLQASAEKAGVFPEIREFTINQSKDSMLRSLFLARADVVCVSCYIWNISIVEDLITEYHNKDLAWRAGGFVPCRGDAGAVSVPCRNYERRGRSDFPGNSSLLSEPGEWDGGENAGGDPWHYIP